MFTGRWWMIIMMNFLCHYQNHANKMRERSISDEFQLSSFFRSQCNFGIVHFTSSQLQILVVTYLKC